MIYFARPIVGITEKIRMVEGKCFDLICGKTTMIYDPANLRIPNAWNISEEAWAQSVFTMDKARAMVFYWEAGEQRLLFPYNTNSYPLSRMK